MVNWTHTFQEIADAAPEYALLPIGAIEQHSFHLPVGTDFLCAQALGERVAEALGNCYLLPTLPISCSREHSDFAGTVYVRPATLAAMLEDIVKSLERQGIKKVVLLVAHGGNWVIKPTVREINLARTGVKVILVAPELTLMDSAASLPDLHAGQTETSLILHLHPELVKADKMAPDFAPEQGREFMDYTGVRPASPTGVWGAPSKGTAEEGEQILEAAAQRAVEYIKKTFGDFERLVEGIEESKRRGVEEA